MSNIKENTPETINFIALLRGPAALLVVWDHLIAFWLDENKIVWTPVTLARTYITRPLGVIQDFGFFGVVLFFLISGFIITYVAQRETRVQFLVKRFFRIYPPLVVSIVLIVAFHTVVTYLTSAKTFMSGRSAGDVLLSMTAMNYFFISQNPINGVAWTLIIEIVFYSLCFAFMPLIKKTPKTAVISSLTLCLLTIYSCRSLGGNFFLFSSVVAYLPFLIMGQIIYYLWSKRISFKAFLLLSAFSYLVLVKGLLTIHTDFYNPGNSYGVSFAYAYFVFVLCMIFEKYISTRNIFGFFSNMSYSLYLNHGDNGYLLLTILYPLTGFNVAITVTLLTVISISYLSYRFIERPSQDFARRLLKVRSSRRD